MIVVVLFVIVVVMELVVSYKVHTAVYLSFSFRKFWFLT